ncbi:MAG: glycosyltransferase family 9 protein, partial [Nitrospinaceae bacterium]|nr:glycosyltransferase family 9 protein [Nitrospinaceae bacterium]
MSDRFLIVRLGAVGDVVHALPLASAIRAAYPNAHIAWAVAPGTSPLLEENPDINQVLIVDTKAWRLKRPLKALSDIRQCIASLREIRADVAIDAQGLIKSGLIVLASGAERRVGFEQRACREGVSATMMTHHALALERPHHVIEKNLSLLTQLGVDIPAREAIRFDLHERVEEGETAASFLGREGLSNGRPLMVIHPGAGWETKRWDVARYAALGDSWIEMSGGGLLLTWGSEEEE